MARHAVTGYAHFVDFLERLNPEDRERLLAASDGVRLAAGELLLRRGERGGDVFLLEMGSLEIVDGRQSPEVVLDVLGPGAVLGEMGFVDGGIRAADVRAVSEAHCRHWGQAGLRRMLEDDSEFSARFYEALTAAVVDRARRQPVSSPSGGIGRLVQDSGPVPVAVAEKAREIADGSRRIWMDAEVRLRISSTDQGVLQESSEAFSLLLKAADVWIGAMGQHARSRDAGEALRREIQPYIGRAKLVFLAQEAGLGANGAEFMAHLLLGEPSGDGALGVVFDQALLDLPTANGVRARQGAAVRAALRDLSDDHPLAVTLVHPNCGALLAKLVTRLTGPGAVVSVIDGDRETLGVVDLGMHKRPDGVDLRLVQEDLSILAAGRSTLHHVPQDVIVVDGLVDHLPDRLVASLATWCAAHLAPGGCVVFTGLAPSSDGVVFDYLVGWPLVRRTPGELGELLGSAGLSPEVVDVPSDDAHCGVTLRATASDGGLPRS